MDIPSRLTSKGQVTVPKPVRDALGVEAGDLAEFGLGALNRRLAIIGAPLS